MKKKRLRELGELGLIELIRKKVPAPKKALLGIGDDAAVFEVGDQVLVITTDTFVENIHFSRAYFSPKDIGYRALAATLSDIAAMAASPSGFLVSLGLPEDLDSAVVEDIYEGFLELASCFDVELWGGDTVSSPTLFLNLTAIGEVKKEFLCFRSGAKEGHLIAVTGDLGGSAAGFLALRQEIIEKGRKKNFHSIIEKHLRPQPKIKEGRFIGAQISGAMEDVSDGLVMELKHITEESGVRAIIEIDKVPINPGAVAFAESFSLDPISLALYGGEDFELVFTATPEEMERLQREAEDKIPFTVIGNITKGAGVFLAKNGEIKQAEHYGYEHFGSNVFP